MEFPALALFYDKVLTDEAPPSVELMVFSQKMLIWMNWTVDSLCFVHCYTQYVLFFVKIE